jgi:hypothetical protein
LAGTWYGEGLSGSINAGNYLASCKVYWLASQEGLCSMELSVMHKVSLINGNTSEECLPGCRSRSTNRAVSFHDGKQMLTTVLVMRTQHNRCVAVVWFGVYTVTCCVDWW